MKNAVALFLVLITLACSPFRQTSFTYNNAGQTFSLPVIVPKGFSKQTNYSDSLGNQIHTFDYKDGAFYYLAFVADTNTFIQPVDTSIHFPQILSSGAKGFKSADSTFKFWREVHNKNLRAGYRYVYGDAEFIFDSASTHFGMMPREK